MELRDLDLNLLVIFQDLLTTGRVAGTAERLGLTQPAVSNALARLRRLLGDELFVRTSQGMKPTPYAQDLAEPVAYALGAIHDALNRSPLFDPARSRQNFTLAMTDIGEIYFLPVLMDHLARIAPHITISTVRNHTINLRQEMEAGHVDLAVGLLPDLQAGFYQRLLLRQRYVCLFRRGHGLDRPGMALAEYQAADHIGVVAAGTGHGQIDDLLARLGIHRRIRLRVPHFTAIGHILAHTDMVATVPEVLALRSAEAFDLIWRPLPLDLPAIDIGLFWHAKYHRDAANQWLRTVIYDLRPQMVAGSGEDTP